MGETRPRYGAIVKSSDRPPWSDPACCFIDNIGWPSNNIAVMKCQIDAAPLTSPVSHVPHMPSNRTPATRV